MIPQRVRSIKDSIKNANNISSFFYKNLLKFLNVRFSVKN